MRCPVAVIRVAERNDFINDRWIIGVFLELMPSVTERNINDDVKKFANSLIAISPGHFSGRQTWRA